MCDGHALVLQYPGKRTSKQRRNTSFGSSLVSHTYYCNILGYVAVGSPLAYTSCFKLKVVFWPFELKYIGQGYTQYTDGEFAKGRGFLLHTIQVMQVFQYFVGID